MQQPPRPQSLNYDGKGSFLQHFIFIGDQFECCEIGPVAILSWNPCFGLLHAVYFRHFDCIGSTRKFDLWSPITAHVQRPQPRMSVPEIWLQLKPSTSSLSSEKDEFSNYYKGSLFERRHSSYLFSQDVESPWVAASSTSPELRHRRIWWHNRSRTCSVIKWKFVVKLPFASNYSWLDSARKFDINNWVAKGHEFVNDCCKL